MSLVVSMLTGDRMWMYRQGDSVFYSGLSLFSIVQQYRAQRANTSQLLSTSTSTSSTDQEIYSCSDCSKVYKSKTSLNLHQRLECGKEPMFSCPFCPKKCHQKGNLKVHIHSKHKYELMNSGRGKSPNSVKILT
ncbi:hypothetical protein J6590_014713 [Homalodisca vitripennis]|nr:hypothetical protein J6590_014713 [Homalodisca vitripennis]